MSAIIVVTIISIISPIVSRVCDECADNDDCIDLSKQSGAAGGVLTCQNFGGDIGDICYWSDDNNPSAGAGFWEESRFCSSDAECSNRFLPIRSPDDYDDRCLRCCANEANAPKSLCTATISSGREVCGIVDEYIGRGVGEYIGRGVDDRDYLFPNSPCCAEDTCLDDIAGVCGVPVEDECGKCTMWSYIIGEEQGLNYYYPRHYYGETADLPLDYTTSDNCGDGLVCMKDSSSESVPYKNEFPSRRLQEELELTSKRRLFASPFLFNFGYCVPESGISQMDGTCTDDNGCPNCMRCCKGKCMRTTGEYECGIEGRGPCCSSSDICSCNQCVTPTAMPTENPTKDDGDDDDVSDDDNEQIFAAVNNDIIGDVNDRPVDNDIKHVKYTVSLNGGNLNNLFIVCVFLIISIGGCIVVYYWRQRTKTQQSFQNDIDQISNI